MKLANRLLLIVGHTLGDLALPLMHRQCERIGATMDNLTSEDADRLVAPLEKILADFVPRRKDLDAIMHEIKVEIGADRYAMYAPTPGGAAAAPRRARAAQPPGR